MKRISRRRFLKIAGTGAAGSVMTCGCSSKRTAVPTSTDTPPASDTPSIETETPAVTKSSTHTPTGGEPAITTRMASSGLLPDRVAYICGCLPDVHNPNGGGRGKLFIGNYCGDSERFLLHWDLSGISPDTAVKEAVLGLFCMQIHGDPSGRLIFAPLKDDWGEAVTYNSQPEIDKDRKISVEWPNHGQWHEIDVTGMVNDWLAAPEENFGLLGFAVDLLEETCSAVYSSIYGLEGKKPMLFIA